MLGNESAQRDDPIDPNLTRLVEFVRLEFGNFSLACFDDVVGGLYHPAKKQAGVVLVGEIVVASGDGSCSHSVSRKLCENCQSLSVKIQQERGLLVHGTGVTC